MLLYHKSCLKRTKRTKNWTFAAGVYNQNETL